MITAFYIEDHTARGLRSALCVFRRNKICVEHLYCDRASVKSVTYHRYRKRISWQAIDRFIRLRRTSLLTPPDIALPQGYRRFFSYELSRRLCENAAVFLLDALSELSPRVVLIDHTGEHTALCPYLIRSTDAVTVFSDDPLPYLSESDRLLCEYGAPITVTKSPECLLTADLIISPQQINRPLLCAEGAVILSSQQPAVGQQLPVICDYSFELPQKLHEMKPSYLDDMYFASALYTLGGVHELGSSVFTRCSDGVILHTRRSLLRLLRAKIERRALS